MDEEIFAQFIAATELIETNPVKRVQRDVRLLCERIAGDLPADIRSAILPSRLSAVANRAREAIESGRAYLLDEIKTEFAAELRAQVQIEVARLRANTSDNEVNRHAHAFEQNLWNGFERKCFRAGLAPDEKILEISARTVTTDRREVARGSDFFLQGRRSGYSAEFWLRQCTADSKIAELEAVRRREAEENERPRWNASPESGAGPNVAPR